MNVDKKQEKAEKLINETIKKWGYIYPEWEFVCRSDPDFFENYNNLYNSSLGREGHLSIRVKEYIALGILAYKGMGTDVLESHIKRAIQNGASTEELLEAVETMIIAGGAPTFFNGLKALLSVSGQKKGE
jgi:alkylhydroperoxidase/carboxymuconolactone decarboxylase family protein YurZ